MAVHGGHCVGLRGGLLRYARKDRVGLAKTEWGSQRRSGVRKDGVGFAKTEWGSQRRSGARNDGVCLCEVVDRGSPWLCTALFAGQVLLNLVYRIVCCRIGV